MAFFAAEQFVLIFNKWHMPLSSMMFDIATKFISALLTHEPASIKNTVPKRPVDRVAMTLLLPIAEGYTQALNVRKYIFHEVKCNAFDGSSLGSIGCGPRLGFGQAHFFGV
eukprot:m.347311 g.347311  ORF g.347311 m.347311 type:complete len:111 (+) comp16144_c0_seq30:2401-2733(+)